MVHLYGSGGVPGFRPDKERGRRKILPLSPDLERIMATSRDPEELAHYWEGWRDRTGRKLGPLFQEYVSLMNEAARRNGFVDAAEMAAAQYDDGEEDDFAQEMENAWEGIRPLYLQLHAFVRNRLVQRC